MRVRDAGVAVALATAVVGLFSSPAQADHSWGNYHWARSGPVQVEVHDSVSSDWDGALSTANADWNQSDVLENTLVADDDSDGTRSSCPAITGAVRVCNYGYGSNGWAGLAEINTDSSGEHIAWGTAKMNDSYLGGDSAEMRQLVMCQEVGHDWGLGHQDEDFNNPNLGTCMDYTNDPSTNQHPNQHDFDQLDLIYGHGDSAAAAGTSSIRTGNRVTIITWAA